MRKPKLHHRKRQLVSELTFWTPKPVPLTVTLHKTAKGQHCPQTTQCAVTTAGLRVLTMVGLRVLCPRGLNDKGRVDAELARLGSRDLHTCGERSWVSEDRGGCG